MRHLFRNKYKLILLFLSFITLHSCSVTFVPSYDAKISEQIDKTSKSIDLFYLTMLETTNESDGSRYFNIYSKKYIEIETELNSLLKKNKIKPLNTHSTRICEITLELWRKYKSIHKKDNNLSNGEIIYNTKVFNDIFYAMQVAEKGKELSNNPPQ